MDKKANDTFAFDLENRLDDFFNETLPPEESSAPEAVPVQRPGSVLKDLKSTILAIDWEITDSVLATFLLQVDELSHRFSTDTIIVSLLKILDSLGKYIRKKKSKAHPETIKRIMAVYSCLETVVSNENLSQAEKEQMLREEISQFKRLKAKIVEAKPVSSSPVQPVKSGETATLEAVLNAIAEVKSLLATELAAIRKEIGQLQKR